MHTPVHTERRTQRAGDSNVTNQEILSDSDRGTSSTSTASTSTTTTSTIPPASVGNTEEPSATHTCTSSSDLFPFLYWIVDPAFLEHRARGRLWPDSNDGARTGAATLPAQGWHPRSPTPTPACVVAWQCTHAGRERDNRPPVLYVWHCVVTQQLTSMYVLQPEGQRYTCTR